MSDFSKVMLAKYFAKVNVVNFAIFDLAKVCTPEVVNLEVLKKGLKNFFEMLVSCLDSMND